MESHKIKSLSLTQKGCTFNPETAVYRVTSPKYPRIPPFHPEVLCPEYLWDSLGNYNPVYEGVRELFHLLGLDKKRYGTPHWNPLGEIIQPGDKVVVKPNFLWHSHKYRSDEWEHVITHGSVIRAVVDYVLIALKGMVKYGLRMDLSWMRIGTKLSLEPG